MAAIAAVVIALVRSGWRTLRGARSFTGNNLVAVIALLMAEEPVDRPSSTAVIYLMAGLLWALPLSQELTQRIPSIRFRLWPLRAWQKTILFAVNLLLNPLIVMAILFTMLSRDRAVGVGIAAAGVTALFIVLIGQALGGRSAGWSPLQWIPRPPGQLGGLMQSHLRELLQLLDVYFALLTAAGGILYCHFSAAPNPAASVVLGHLVVILLSTCAQGSASFDAPALETRLRLLPLSGVAVLFARDAAWLLVTIPLIAGFRPLPCTAAALAALIMGHRTSIDTTIQQKRWHFAAGRLVPQGVLQLIGLIVAGAAVTNGGWPAFAAVTVVYAGSLWWSGREWDRR